MFKFWCVVVSCVVVLCGVVGVVNLGCLGARSHEPVVEQPASLLDGGSTTSSQDGGPVIQGSVVPGVGTTRKVWPTTSGSLGCASSLCRLLTPRLDKILEQAMADHSRLQTLQGLILYTDRLDAPTVVIGPAPWKPDDSPQVRVKVKFPGRRWVTVDHYDLSLALQQALRLGIGMTRNPEDE